MFDIEDQIKHKISEVAAIADALPTVVIVHRYANNFATVEYMSKRGLDELNTTVEELRAMGPEYFSRYFNLEDAKDYVPKIGELLLRNDPNEVFSFFQQVRSSDKAPWAWYFSQTKVLLSDDQGYPVLSITTASRVDPVNHVTHTVARLLDENNFLRQKAEDFAKLSAREKQVLGMIALSKSNQEISDELFLSLHTVQTHRKNIKRKLQAENNFALQEFARAFDLI